jgi:hypothetical protein
VVAQNLERYAVDAPRMRSKRVERQGLCSAHRTAKGVMKRRVVPKRVGFDCSSLSRNVLRRSATMSPRSRVATTFYPTFTW